MLVVRSAQVALAVVLMAATLGCVAVAAVWGAISAHLLMILFAIAAGIVVAVLSGVPLFAGAVAGGAGGAAAILAEPPPPPQTVTNINGPGARVAVRAVEAGAAGIPTWVWIAVAAGAFVLWHIWKHGNLIQDKGWIKGILGSLRKVK